MQLRLALAALVGVLCAFLSPLLWPPGVLAAALLPCLWPLLWRRLATAAFCVFLIALVYAQSVVHVHMAARLPSSAHGQTVLINGRVASLPERGPGRLHVEFDVDAQQPVRGTLRLSWYGEDLPSVRAGERWQFALRMSEVHGLANPAGFDFERHALVRGLHASATVQQPDSARRLQAATGLVAWREQISEQIAASLPGRSHSEAILRGLVVGDTRALSDDDWSLWRALGLTHLIAISGLHITMVAGLGALLMSGILWAMPRLGLWLPRAQWRAIAALVFAFGYTLMAGFEVPAKRTLIMLAAFLLATLLRRQMAPFSGWALALVAVLILDPTVVLSSGFWLSFVAVGWLLLAFAGRWAKPNLGLELVRTQLLMSLALLPLTIAWFQQASIVGPLANLVAVPVVTFIVVPLALFGTALFAVHAGAAGALLGLSSWVLEKLLALLSPLASVPMAQWYWPAPTALGVSLFGLGVIVLLAPRGLLPRWAALPFFVPLLLPMTDRPASGEVTVDVLDVGQGLAVLVRTAEHALLYDTGPGQRGSSLVASQILPSLHALGVHRLDAVVVSHADADHAGGLSRLRAELPIAARYSSAPSRLPDTVKCAAGTRFDWDGVRFEFLHPSAALPYRGNESSCVLHIRTRSRSALLPGDITPAVESRLLQLFPDLRDVDLLVAPHHGSRSASTPAFVSRIRPRTVVYAMGLHNRFGFPAAEVVARYDGVGAASAQTARDGALRWASATSALSAQRVQQRRVWQRPRE